MINTHINQNKQALSFLQERALDKNRTFSNDEYEILHTLNMTLQHTDEVQVQLGGKAGRLGECVVGTGLLESMLLALVENGKAGIPVHIVVDEEAAELFDEKAYQEYYWPQITIEASSYQRVNSSYSIMQSDKNNVLVLDFHGAHDDIPYMYIKDIYDASHQQTKRITILCSLFRVGVRNYAYRGPERRYADFIEELFALPEGVIAGQKAQPHIRLSSRDTAKYPLLARQFHLRRDALQIVCFFQSIVLAKCYERWHEVMMLLCEYSAKHFPQQRIDFLLACGPDTQLPPGVRKMDITEEFSNFSGVENNARTLIYSTPSLRDLAIVTNYAMMALSNDTGPGHIAGALGVPTITPYLPGDLYSKRVWSSTLWHHGVTIEPNPFSYQQLENAILWGRTDIINCTEPEEIHKLIVNFF